MKSTTTILRTLLIGAFALLSATSITAAANDPQEPDWELYFPDLLDVKFREGTQVRLRGGRPQDLGANAAVRSDLDRIAQQFPAGLWQRGHSLSEAKLTQLRSDGMTKSGRNLPDLNLYQRLTLPRGMNAWQAKKILEGFAAIEAAHIVPRLAAPPAAPDYTNSANPSGSWQGYLAPNPGVDAFYAWSLGWDGNGVSVCDVESNFNAQHQDLPPVTIVGEAPIQSTNGIDPGQIDHGTAVLGEIAGVNEGANTGIKGIAFNAQLYFASQWTAGGGLSQARAILECAAALDAGDIILLELQTTGPNSGSCWPNNSGCGLVPTEWYKPNYDAIVTAVANDIIVIEASGNGSENLDDPAYSTGNDGHWPFLPENDSGAIIVTGGSSTTQHGPLFYSNWGSAVDLQAWGENIVTSGLGDHYSAEGGSLLYTKSFGGSSGASPIVVGAAAAVQEAYKFFYGTPMSSAAMKDLLVSTGTPGGAVCGSSICPPGSTLAGIPIPNLRAARDNIIDVRVYVDRAATGANDGTSWVDAYSGQNALKNALDAAAAGTQIYVAQGVHYPTSLNGPRTATFQLKNRVTVLGGYPTGGGERDPVAYATYLSGNISDAAPAFTNDTYHLVTGGGTDASAILDGFTIAGGNADGAFPHDRGGGIYISNGAPTIRETVVHNNRAVYGAGVFANGAGPDGAAPRLLDVTVQFNIATQRGGGVFNFVSGATQLIDVTYHANEAALGGGLFNEGAGTNPQVVNNRFYGNTGNGAAIYNFGGGFLLAENTIVSGNSGFAAINNNGGDLQLNNVTIANSTGFGLTTNASATMKNSIVWANASGQINGAATVSDSIVQGGHAGTNVLIADPLLRDADGADNVAGTLDDDLRLQGAPTPSPAIDAADVAASDCVATDIAGSFRNVGAYAVGTPNGCDMGAYEYLGGPGGFWSNGEVDRRLLAESFDETPIGGPVRHSADDFVVPAGQICQVSAIRAVLHDPTQRIDAIAQIFADAGGSPGTYFAGLSVGASCSNTGAACTDQAGCATPVACTSDAQCTAGSGGQCLSSPNQSPPFSGTYCTYACVAPGRSLGGSAALDPCLVAGVTNTCAGGRLWEYEFEISPPLAFAEGTHWVSVFGTVEAGSTGQSYWVSAGDDAVRANSYRFREQGAGWVDGGPFNGDIARDLALEIDAVCAAAAPPNDGFGSASAVGAPDGSFEGTLAGASNDGSTSGAGSDQPDVWYRYTAPGPGTLRVNTCGSNGLDDLDTVLSVHTDTGVTGSAANQIAINDDWQDAGGDLSAGCPASLDSAVAVQVAQGEALLFRVSRYSANSDGAFNLNVSFELDPPPNDGFANALAIDAGGTAAQGTLLGATRDGASSADNPSYPDQPDVWYRYVAPATGTLHVDTCGSIAFSDIDTVLSVHTDTGAAGTIANELAGNDNWQVGGDPGANCPHPLDSSLAVSINGGDSILIRVSRGDDIGGPGFVLNVSLTIDPPPNDDFANAIAIGDGSVLGTLLGASNDGSGSSGIAGEPDVWYAYTAAAPGTLRIDTCGSQALTGLDSVVTVHTNTGVVGTTANELAFNDDSIACPIVNGDAGVELAVNAGDALLIRVARSDNTTDGDFILNLSLEVAAADTDGDGITDDVDNCVAHANADQRDSNGDGFGNRCDADLNDDCIVNPIDLGIFRVAFFGTDPHADLNGDGVVNPVDLGIFRSLFFLPPGPSGAPNACP